ncbi:MAG: glycerophosphodiester phosphodiesterase [Acidimicrobiia bacterium]|nr:MAG: glycerophosphodiester phosphodiesterase [Acidimicrobiia bacterium]
MPYETPAWTQIVAHRGNSGPMPENTMIAIDSAIELGVDMVEVDVRLTRDGVPVLVHNDRIDHTTSGTGFVQDLTWDELRSLDAGSWRGVEFAKEPIRSLKEVLDLTVGKVALNLDVKVSEAARPAAIAATRADACDRVVISGCSEHCVREIRELTDAISTLLNLDELLAGVDRAEAPAVALASVDCAADVGAIAINVPHSLVNANLVEYARNAGIGVWAYTIDDETRFAELLQTGVDSLTTNWPERMLPIAHKSIGRPGSGSL